MQVMRGGAERDIRRSECEWRVSYRSVCADDAGDSGAPVAGADDANLARGVRVSGVWGAGRSGTARTFFGMINKTAFGPIFRLFRLGPSLGLLVGSNKTETGKTC